MNSISNNKDKNDDEVDDDDAEEEVAAVVSEGREKRDGEWTLRKRQPKNGYQKNVLRLIHNHK